MSESRGPLLSIVIPSYGRSGELLHALGRFAEQMARAPEGEVELQVVDDASPGETGELARKFVEGHQFMSYRRHPANIGLERNLLECTKAARGEYLWIFGDDDYLEREDSLETVLRHLRSGEADFYILNRTRRNSDLSRLLSANWMQIDPNENHRFAGLKEFCLKWGLVSIIGFISVNIFRRAPFAERSAEPYAGTMYPQLGMMVEAFHDKPCLLIARPLVCHRTQSVEEKRQGWGRKAAERNFFGDAFSRDVSHFGIRWVKLLRRLAMAGALEWDDICRLPESTVIDGYLIDFILNNIELALELGHSETLRNWLLADDFFARLNLTGERKERWLAMR